MVPLAHYVRDTEQERTGLAQSSLLSRIKTITQTLNHHEIIVEIVEIMKRLGYKHSQCTELHKRADFNL